MILDSEHHVSVVYPSDSLHSNEIFDNTIDDSYEKPSLETENWAVYWDERQKNWYFYDKLKGQYVDIIIFC